MRIILCAWNFSLSAIHNNKSCGWAHSCLGSKKMANYTKKLVQTSAKVQNVLYGSTCGSNKQFDTLSNRNFTTFLFFIFFCCCHLCCYYIGNCHKYKHCINKTKRVKLILKNGANAQQLTNFFSQKTVRVCYLKY